MLFHTCESDSLWGAASCSRAEAIFKAPHRQLCAWCGVCGFSIASVSAPRARNQDNFHTAVRHWSVGYFLLSLTSDKEDRLGQVASKRRRTDHAHVWSTSRILERARSYGWQLFGHYFLRVREKFLKPLEGRMDVKSKRYCSLTYSASLLLIVMETSQAMEVEMLDGSSVISSFTELWLYFYSFAEECDDFDSHTHDRSP